MISFSVFFSPHRVKNEFESIPSYIHDDIDNWSMYDFVNVRNGTFVVQINTIIQKGEEHVFNCEVSLTFYAISFNQNICRYFKLSLERFHTKY